jgi:hypothetical protein
MSKALPTLTGDPRVDRLLIALARLAAEVVRSEQAAAKASDQDGPDEQPILIGQPSAA